MLVLMNYGLNDYAYVPCLELFVLECLNVTSYIKFRAFE